jgi:hypothetical protein
LYTADCRSSHGSCLIDKFADDTGLTGQITDDNDTHYRQEVNNFVDWCEENYLDLNTGKTKEMIFDTRRKKGSHEPIMIAGVEVEQVESYRYLGVVIDNKLSWHANTDQILKKAHTRMYCLRKLRSFSVREDILQMFFLSTVGSVLTYACVCWWGNLSKQDSDRLEKIVKKAGSVVGKKQETIESVCQRRLTERLTSILADETHPLRPEFDSRRIDRSGRLRAPVARTSRFRNSFIPSAIHAFNQIHAGGR